MFWNCVNGKNYSSWILETNCPLQIFHINPQRYDIVAATECDSESCESVKTNSVINKFIESKKLQFGPEKCHQMHVGSDSSNNKNCKTLQVHNETMTKVDQEKYVGDIISSNTKYKQISKQEETEDTALSRKYY